MSTLRQRIWLAILLVVGAPQAANAELRYSIVEGYGGVPLNVVEAGKRGAPGILLVHGFAQSYLAFKYQLDSNLAETFHVVAFDMRGHGVSAKPWNSEDYADSRVWADDLQAVIAATQLKNPVLVGWSYGGYVVTDYIRHFGVNNVAGVSLVGSPGGLVSGSPPAMTDDIKRMIANSERSRSLKGEDNLQAAKATGELLSTPNMTDKERDLAFAMQIMMPAYVRRLMRGRDLNNVDMVDALTLPVLLVRGADDTVISAETAQLLLEALSDARLSTYDATGHLPFFEDPKRFNRELADFARHVQSGQ